MRIPTATYRFQFNYKFGFQSAKETLAYLFELGISDVYASPIFKARSGSMHGYDIVDPNQLNPELGSHTDFEDLIGEVKNLKMGWLQDIVPNHMAFDYENQMLMDVLENGESSRFYHFFDIAWDHPYESIKGRLLAPFLGRFYGECLENAEIKLNYGGEGFTVNYYGLILPLKIESYVYLLNQRLGNLEIVLGKDHPDYTKLLEILYMLKTLPSGEYINERYGQVRFIKRRIWQLFNSSKHIREFIESNISYYNGSKENPESFNCLHQLLTEQLFDLSFWKVATEEINYRRFFTINDLIGLTVEEEDVFHYTHSFLSELINKNFFTGLRVDHIDGLYDPAVYLKRLKNLFGENLYIIVEKILDLYEELPLTWHVQGTTGYDFLNTVNGPFCNQTKQKEFSKIYSKYSGITASYDALVHEKKKLIIETRMAGDLDNLAHLLKNISGFDRHGSDFTIYGLKKALVEVMANYPVYRTYINKDIFRSTDEVYIKRATEKAKLDLPGLLNELDFVERILLLRFRQSAGEEERKQWLHFVMKFQQLTGPLMAKGVEDTLLYTYNRLLSLNEVGGSPHEFGTSLEAFHVFNKNRADNWPHSLNATSTHDTKRGEDVRARLNVLSEIPGEWQVHLAAWNKINKKKKHLIKGKLAPDKNDEYFLYQTLLGTFPFYEDEYPFFVTRLKEYIIKAVREAKIHTAWLRPDSDYENAFVSFVESILDSSETNSFLKSFLPFQQKISFYGMFNSLSQTLIKVTSPGVPDFYQGTELWDFTFVDPDNRRPVDFKKRKAMLQEIRGKAMKNILELIDELFLNYKDSRIKLFLIHRLLETRRKYLHVFQKGGYTPLKVSGTFSNHVIAFARFYEKTWAVSVAPRFLTSLIKEERYPFDPDLWSDTSIVLPEESPHEWKDGITDQGLKGEDRIPVKEILQHFPVALLVNSSEGTVKH